MTRRTLTVRVADLLVADRASVCRAADRVVPGSIGARIVETGAGTLVTLDRRVEHAFIGGRTRAIRTLQALLTALRAELESGQSSSGDRARLGREGRS